MPYSLSEKYSINTNIIESKAYLFRYRAHNVFGWGDWSDNSSIIAAAPPDTVESVTTELIGTDIKLSWSASTNANGSPITEYDV